ncbi:MAG: PilZ domain-containing protein [Gammaproteobacteria bacterium]|jgi:c-di-GMP-binding flagellar brake protein YcgR
MQGQDQRKTHRVRFSAEAVLSFDQTPYAVQIVDISLMGALLLMLDDKRPLPEPGGICRFELALDTRHVIQIACQVVRTADDHLVGVSFDELDIDSASHLHRLLVVNLGEEELLARDLDALIEAHLGTR